jgi:hypothetical protein
MLQRLLVARPRAAIAAEPRSHIGRSFRTMAKMPSAEISAKGIIDCMGNIVKWVYFFGNLDGRISRTLLIELCFRRGTNGPNRYGPDPLAKA